MQTNKKHVKNINASGINGTVTVEGDQVLFDVSLRQQYWGTKFLLIPWLKTRTVKHKLVRSRNGSRFTSPVGRFHEDDFDPVMLSVMFELANDSFVEYDAAYPEEVLDEVELSDGETFDVVEEIAGATSYTETAEEVAEVVESIDNTFDNISEQDQSLQEVLAETEAEIASEVAEPVYSAPQSTYVAPEPTYSAPEPSPAPSYSAPEPSYSSPSPSPSYDSSPSYSSSSSDSSSSSYD